MSFSCPIPVLRIFDENAARAFYLDYLGFKLHWEHRFEPGMPAYMQVSRGDCLLHLSGHHGDGAPGAKLRSPARTSASCLRNCAESRTPPCGRRSRTRPGAAKS